MNPPPNNTNQGNKPCVEVSKCVTSINAITTKPSQHRPTHNYMQEHSLRKHYKLPSPSILLLNADLGVVRRYAELFVRVGLVRSEGGDYVPARAEYLDGLFGTVGMVFLVCVHVPYA